MLDTLLNLAKGELGGALTEQVGLESGQIDDVMKVIGGTVTKEVVKESASGGLDTIMNLFSGKENTSAASSLQERIAGNIVTNLIEKLGIGEGMAQQISTIAVPMIMNMISKKNDETPDDDPSPLEGLFGMATGALKGSSGGGMLGGILGKLGL